EEKLCHSNALNTFSDPFEFLRISFELSKNSLDFFFIKNRSVDNDIETLIDFQLFKNVFLACSGNYHKSVVGLSGNLFDQDHQSLEDGIRKSGTNVDIFDNSFNIIKEDKRLI